MWHRLLLWAVLLGALLLVFLAYQSPHLARDLADRLWACF
jgi:hypothetical protein